MKALVITILLGTSLGHAQTLVRWVGSLPPAQVSSAVELVNQELRGRIQLEYTMDEKAVARIVSGDLSDGYDLVQMKDAEMLNAAAQEGAIQAIPSWGSLTLRETLRDPALRWVGLLKRHRIIYYDSNKVNPADIPTYESLANPRFQGKLCLRQVKSQYNVGLYSFFLALWGEQKMREVLAGWARNSESQPLIEKDLDGVIARIANGDCEVGVANTYYYLRHL
ncbi:MAG: ABC transporter substrate-binding protein, partial [Bdellovibrionaceae bacterium]|nr:ABC transporter substrate-binding protein [Pseudobdellovibrionaceae bacterium]